MNRPARDSSRHIACLSSPCHPGGHTESEAEWSVDAKSPQSRAAGAPGVQTDSESGSLAPKVIDGGDPRKTLGLLIHVAALFF